MIYKNIEIFNAQEIITLEDGVTWRRFPKNACDKLELDKKSPLKCENSTGAELRFVIKGDSARIRMASLNSPLGGLVCTFHVYYGNIQGGWCDHEVHKLIENQPKDFIFKTPDNIEELRAISQEAGYEFDPAVVRIIFDRGNIKLLEIEGDVEPPKSENTPKKTLLSYGSSITHGSNSFDTSHAWVSVTSHMLNMDARNLGMAGSCAIEPQVIDYIASEGKAGRWDIATLELGINVLNWEEDKIYSRVDYAIRKTASENPDKPIIVISPFYCHDDYTEKGKAARWREIIIEVCETADLPNVYYKSGLDFIDSMEYISADMVHPNIYGVQRIAAGLVDFIKSIT